MSDLTVDIDGPQCGRVLKIKVKEMYAGNSKACTCGFEIVFSGGNGRKVQRSLNQLERKIKSLSRKFK